LKVKEESRKKLDGWLSLSTDPFKSGYAQLSAPALISIRPPASFREAPKDQASDVELHIGESRDSGFALTRAPRNGSLHVSTNPVLEPLATESLWP
jgi:hypothetical protein